MQSSLYQGETPAISRAPQGQTPTTHPMQQIWEQNTARATQNAYNLEDTIVDYIEDTRTQQLKTEQNQIEADLKDDLTRALSLANGAPGSPFKKDGLPNETAIRSLINKHQSRIKNWESGYLSLQGAETAARAQQQFRTSIGNTVRATITSALKPRALSAFKNNYNYAITQGRTQDAIASVDDLYNKGYIDEAEAALYKLDAQEKGLDYRIANLQNFEEADSLYHSDFYDKLTPRQKNNLTSIYKNLAAQSTPPAVVLKSGRKAGSTNPQDYEKTAPLPPADCPYYMIDCWETNDGNFKAENPNARLQAAGLLFRWAMDTIPVDNPTDTEWETIFRIKAKAFGQDDSAISNAIKQAREHLADNTSPNFKKAVESIPDSALVNIPSAQTIGMLDHAEILAHYSQSGDKKEAIRNFYAEHIRYTQGETAEKQFLDSGLSGEDFLKAQAKARRDLIQAEYSSWVNRDSNSRANYDIKLAELNKAARNNTYSPEAVQQAMQPYINLAYQQEIERRLNAENTKRQQQITAAATQGKLAARRDLAARPSAPLHAPLSYATTETTALPYSTTAPIVYVPKGYTALGKSGSDVALVHPTTGKNIGIRIIETEKVDHPHISAVLYKQLGLHLDRTRPALHISRNRGALFITRDQFEQPSAIHPAAADWAERAEQGIISPTNQLFPEEDDDLVPIEEAEPVASAYPTGDLPL
jgi:hypothetical protein